MNGAPVSVIHADLSSGVETTIARKLLEMEHIQHEADKKGGPFDIAWEVARNVLAEPSPHGESSHAVCRPWANGQDTTQRTRAKWIIDFPPGMNLSEAASFAAAFKYVQTKIAPQYAAKRKTWWIHERPRPSMRAALDPLRRYIGTPILTKHRLFVWLDHDVLPDHQLVVFARSDDYFFGVLHCSIHELWARRMGTQLREAESGFRYTPTTCFETFPLPWPPGREPSPQPSPGVPGEGKKGKEDVGKVGQRELWQRISDAARELNEKRERWLNPPEWIEQVAAKVDAADRFEDVPEAARALIRQSAIMAAAAKDSLLKKRTLTNLYNERPTWLKLAHEQLDRAVLAAYAAVDPAGGWSEDWAAVWVDSGAGQNLAEGHPLASERGRVDGLVLANLLRLNQQRAGAGD